MAAINEPPAPAAIRLTARRTRARLPPRRHRDRVDLRRPPTDQQPQRRAAAGQGYRLSRQRSSGEKPAAPPHTEKPTRTAPRVSATRSASTRPTHPGGGYQSTSQPKPRSATVPRGPAALRGMSVYDLGILDPHSEWRGHSPSSSGGDGSRDRRRMADPMAVRGGDRRPCRVVTGSTVDSDGGRGRSRCGLLVCLARRRRRWRGTSSHRCGDPSRQGCA